MEIIRSSALTTWKSVLVQLAVRLVLPEARSSEVVTIDASGRKIEVDALDAEGKPIGKIMKLKEAPKEMVEALVNLLDWRARQDIMDAYRSED